MGTRNGEWKEIVFRAIDKSRLPSMEEVRDEIIRQYPNGFTVKHWVISVCSDPFGFPLTQGENITEKAGAR